MSANDPARPQSSRRAFLAGAVAGAATIPIVGNALAAEPDPVDTLFRAWMDVQDRVAAVPSGHLPDEMNDEQNAVALGLERQIGLCPPSLMRAGALALFSLRWGIMFVTSIPAEIEGEADGGDAEAILAMAVLPCLLPSLSGTVREVAADFLAHPSRAVRHSRLFSSDNRRA